MEAPIRDDPGAVPDVTFPEPVGGYGHLDLGIPASRVESEQLAEMKRRIETGDFDLPHMPSTSITILKLSSDPTVDVEDIARVLETDPVLSAEILRTANSVMFGGARAADTLQQAVIRLGLRQVRALVLALSMKSVIFRSRTLMPVAREVWRQSFSMGVIARQLSGPLGFEPDRGFLIGQLHDIGKIPLLEILREVVKGDPVAERGLIGRAFGELHELAGASMAASWNLPNEICSVAGSHHRFRENLEHPKAAALANLVHQIDLQLSVGDESEFWDLRLGDEWKCLGVSFEERRTLLTGCVGAFVRE
ncbi:MAG: HDOD domain-containing protein [Planctomycetota bacterium]